MSEIAKCPLCGATIMLLVKGTAECFKCPFTCSAKDLPRIAAAIELAELEVKFENCKPKEEHQYQEMIGWARERVLEVREQADKYLKCTSAEIYDLADCLCLEYHECVDALDRVAELEKQLKDAKREAEDLAIFLWKKKYDNDGLGFELCDSVAGIIAQIDNMVAEMLQEEEAVKFKAINSEIVMELVHIYAVNSFRLGSYERIDILQNNGVYTHRSVELRDKCAANKEALLRYLETGVK